MTKKEKGRVEHTGFEHLNMDVAEAIDAMECITKAGATVMLFGSPGIGKTTAWHELGKRLNRPVHIFNPSQLDMIDIKYPYLEDAEDGNGKVSKFAISDQIPRDGNSILVVDEINTCMPSSAPMWYSLTLEKRIGTYHLPEGTIVGATGNRVFDRSAAQPMQLAQKDRMVHINVRPSMDSFCEWGAKNQLIPEVLAYVRDIPTCLEAVDFDDPAGGCTPRSLHRLSDLIKTGLPVNLEDKLIQGTIGKACGIEFASYLEIFRNKISIDQILKDPKGYKIPKDRSDIKYCIATGLAARANKKNIDKVIEFCSENMEKTYSVICLRDVVNRDESLGRTKSFMKFATENVEFFA